MRVEDESGTTKVPGRRGGAGPSDAGFVWVRGLPLTVPMHSRFAQASPSRCPLDERSAKLFRGDEYVGPVAIPPQPKIYEMSTADGVPYWEDRAAAPGFDRLDGVCRSASTGARTSSAASAASS